MNDLKVGCTRKHKSSISHATSYKEIAEFWETQDLSGFWNGTEEVSFDVEIKSETIYYAEVKKDTDNKSGDKSWK
ncbi:MAG TPA: hypothetical protein ACFYD7_06685 [Candidatus Wujingus californicus]|uniref:hypothetical protein n=1 Tax=Candidatus Wujingus californicus TaxID=3367618 RepID=UPI001DAA4039|nr:hypothetical protein [Planctomycetota bacterium]MDO8130986.1 hypothetical protein [Candidatus Brocadiales bacterium]